MSTQTQSHPASRFSAKTLTMCAIFTALVAVCSQITIPLPIIPINLALFAVYLAGALLGPWRGALSLLVYLLLAAVGVPVMAGFRGGLGNLVGNTGGYVVGYIFAALFTGLLAEKWGARFWQLCVAMVVGCAVCYFFGTLWYCYSFPERRSSPAFPPASSRSCPVMWSRSCWLRCWQAVFAPF